MATITTTGSGDSNSTTPNAPWPSGTIPVVGDKVIIASGHTVIMTSTHTWGDDTSTGIQVNGILKASRAVSSSLTCRGDLFIGVGGVLNYGTEADTIPSSVVAEILINDSATQANNKWGLRTDSTAEWTRVSFWGSTKTGDTTITSPALSTDTVLNVGDTTGWAIGDLIAVSTNTPGSSPTIRAITAVTSTTCTVGASLGAARVTGTKIINLTRNVRVYGKNGNTYGANIVIYTSSSYATVGSIEFGNAEFRLGGGGATTQTGTGVSFNYAATPTRVNIIKKVDGLVCHTVWSAAGSTVVSLAVGTTSKALMIFYSNSANAEEIASIYMVSTIASAYTHIILYQGASVTVNNFKSLAGSVSTAIVTSFNQGAVNCKFTGGWINGGLRLISGSGIKITLNNIEIDAQSIICSSLAAIGLLTINECTIANTFGLTDNSSMITHASGYYAPINFNNCTIPDALAFDMTATTYKQQSPENYILFTNRNLDINRHEKYVSGGRILRQSTEKYRSRYAMQFDCYNSGVAISETTQVTIQASETILLKGYVKYSSGYGTATPPTVTVSGMGITPQVFTCSAVTDTWLPYSFTISNPQSYAGKLTVTFSAQTATPGSTAKVYFDGLLVSPYCTDARHYGYLFNSIIPNQVVNPYVVETEANAAAYTGISINGSTKVITISSAHTLQELYDYREYWLVQTTNLAFSDPLSADGNNTFTLTNGYVVDVLESWTSGTLNDGTLGFSTAATYTIDVATTTLEFTAASGVYDLSESSISGAVTLINSGGGSITVKLPYGTTATNTGPNITLSLQKTVSVSIPNLINGTRVRVYNETDAVELDNSVVSGGAGYALSYIYTGDKTISVKACYQSGLVAKTPIVLTGLITEAGATFLDAQVDDDFYIAIGLDGSLVDSSNGGELTANFADIEIDVTDPDGIMDARRALAWWRYIITTSVGIAQYNPLAIIYNPDEYNVLVDGPLTVNNVNVAALTIVNGVWKRLDNVSLIAPTSNTIHWVPDGRVYTDSGSRNALAAIKKDTSIIPALL